MEKWVILQSCNYSLLTLRVVLQFEGEAVNNELSGSRLAALIMDHPNRLNAEVAAVSTGEECHS